MFLKIVGILLVVLGAYNIGRPVFDLWRSRRSPRWPQVKGKILASESRKNLVRVLVLRVTALTSLMSTRLEA